MRKDLLRAFFCILFAVCLLSLSACSTGKKPDSSSGSSVESAGSSTESTGGAGTSSVASAGGRTETGKYATVKDFVNSDLMQNQLKTMREQLGTGENGLEVNVTGEENKMVFTFLYKLGDQDAKTVSAYLEGAMESMEKSFEVTAASLKEAVEVENPVVVVTYVAEDGTELYSKEFSAK